jgi:hypothetical protein
MHSEPPCVSRAVVDRRRVYLTGRGRRGHHPPWVRSTRGRSTELSRSPTSTPLRAGLLFHRRAKKADAEISEPETVTKLPFDPMG